jgi:hypothetical protein
MTPAHRQMRIRKAIDKVYLNLTVIDEVLIVSFNISESGVLREACPTEADESIAAWHRWPLRSPMRCRHRSTGT